MKIYKRYQLIIMMLVALAVISVACHQTKTPASVKTTSAENTKIPVLTFTPTFSRTPTLSHTLTKTATKTSSLKGTITPSRTPTLTRAVTPSRTPTQTRTVTPSKTATKIFSKTPTITHTPTTRQAGRFYEVRTNLSEEERQSDSLTRTCDNVKSIMIENEGTNIYRATFFVNDEPVGPSYDFKTEPIDGDLWVGGANISSHTCTMGVVISGWVDSHQSDYEVSYVVAQSGLMILPDGHNYYPKMNQTNGVLYVEPRTWFSPDDTIAMTIAAADVGWNANMAAHFIDIRSGRSIGYIPFDWLLTVDTLTPYAAEIDNSRGKSQIVFKLNYQEIGRIDVP